MRKRIGILRSKGMSRVKDVYRSLLRPVTTLSSFVLIAVIILIFSPIERNNVLGAYGFLFGIISIASVLFVGLISSASIYVGEYVLPLVNILAIITLFVILLADPARLTIASEHGWARALIVFGIYRCENNACGKARILAKQEWDDGCSRYLFYYHDCGALDAESCFRKTVKVDAGSKVYQQQIGTDLFSDILCEP